MFEWIHCQKSLLFNRELGKVKNKSRKYKEPESAIAKQGDFQARVDTNVSR